MSHNKPSKNTKKCLLIASFMGSVMKAHQPDVKELIILHRQINRAMKVYSIKAGKEEYHSIVSEGAKIWKILSEEYSTRLESDEVELFVDLMGTLIHPKNYEEFLNVPPFMSTQTLAPETMLKVCNSLLALDELVNDLLDTKSYRITIPVIKKVKVKKVRDKSKKVKKIKQQPLPVDRDKQKRKQEFFEKLRKLKEDPNPKRD